MGQHLSQRLGQWCCKNVIDVVVIPAAELIMHVMISSSDADTFSCTLCTVVLSNSRVCLLIVPSGRAFSHTRYYCSNVDEHVWWEHVHSCIVFPSERHVIWLYTSIYIYILYIYCSTDAVAEGISHSSSACWDFLFLFCFFLFQVSLSYPLTL